MTSLKDAVAKALEFDKKASQHASVDYCEEAGLTQGVNETLAIRIGWVSGAEYERGRTYAIDSLVSLMVELIEAGCWCDLAFRSYSRKCNNCLCLAKLRAAVEGM